MNRTGRVTALLLASALLLQVVASPGFASAEFPTTWTRSGSSVPDYTDPTTGNYIEVTTTLEAASALDANHVWAVGAYYDPVALWQPFIASTADGGASWLRASPGAGTPAVQSLNGVDAVDSTHVWAVGNRGLILKWNGSSWAQQGSGVSNDLYAVSFADAANGWAVGASGTMLRTVDGGASWTKLGNVTSNALRGVAYPSTSVAYAVGDNGVALRWSGSTWVPVASGTTNVLKGVAFTDATHGWAVGDANTFLRWDGSLGRYVASAPVPVILTPGDARPRSVSFSDSLNGIAAGEFSMVWRTNDGGVHWAVSQLPEAISVSRNVKLNGVAAVSGDPTRAWAAGDNEGFTTSPDDFVYSGALSLTAPAAPSGLAAQAGTPGPRTALSWTDGSIDEEGFQIERSTNPTTGFSRIATPSVNATSYADTSVDWSTTFYYRVRAYNAAGYSAFTAPATGIKLDSTAPSVSSNATTTPYQYSASITISATDAQSGVSRVVYRLNGGSDTSGTVVTLGLGTYSLEYRALDNAGNWSAYSTPITVEVVAPGTLRGTVSVAGGGALEGVTVSVPGTGTVPTNASGWYSVGGVTPGVYTVTYSKAGHSTETTSVTIASGSSVTRDMTLRQLPGTLTGTVRDSGGNALSGVTVSVPGTGTVTTNASGVYTVASVTPGAHTVTYTKTGYGAQTRGVTVTSGQTTVQDVSLAANPGTLSGTVRESGTGLGGVTVSVGTTWTTTTVAGGTYSIPGIAAGAHTVTYTKAGYSTESTSVTIASDATTTKDVTLSLNPGAVNGTVRDGGGNALSGVSVQVDSLAPVLTNASGFYSVGGLSAGSHSITYTKLNWATAVSSVSISAGATTAKDIALVPNPGTLSGTVRDTGGSALSGVTVSVGTTWTTTTAAGGTYSISGITPGAHTVTYAKTNYSTETTSATIASDVTTTKNVSLVANPGSLVGTVTVGGAPLAGATVNVDSTWSTTTGASGTYSLANVSAGNHSVTFSKTGYSTETTSVTIVAGQAAARNATLSRTVSLMPVYRFYNGSKGVHFYTASADERDKVIATLGRVYAFEGVAYYVNTASPNATQNLYRFYNGKQGVHFYTASDTERNTVIRTLGQTYTYEGVAYKVSTNPADQPAYRFYNGSKGVHFYTASDTERNTVIATLGRVYSYEGTAFYVPK